jgi:hypothetical protein
MLTGSYVPCIQSWPVSAIQFQGKVDGYNTDDVIVFMQDPNGDQTQKLLGQIKHSVALTTKDQTFGSVIASAWADFNNVSKFQKNQDALALITGPLSGTDIDGARMLLEWARTSQGASDFFLKVSTGKFSSDNKRRKLAAFQHHICKANGNRPPADSQFFDFLRHFYLLSYDLDLQSGVVLALVHSLVGQYTRTSVRGIWTQIVDEVQTFNKNAGTITKANLSKEVRDAFVRRSEPAVPEELEITKLIEGVDWNQFPNSSELALLNLIGSWSDSNASDCAIVESITHQKYLDLLSAIREILQDSNCPIRNNEGQWRIKQRHDLWRALGSRILDKDLAELQASLLDVLSERDPKFDMPEGERHAAGLYGKNTRYSKLIRRGLAETLALLGTTHDVLTHCTQQACNRTIAESLHKLLGSSDWQIWASLNDILPLLAEASPAIFLNLLDAKISEEPEIFSELYSQEKSGIFSENYLTGVYWALENIAWEGEHLSRACLVLSNLAEIDPGGKMANRPLNSLVNILLPWHAQTTASVADRHTALKNVCREQPIVGWKVILELLPNSYQTASNSHKPIFRLLPAIETESSINRSEYLKSIDLITELAIELAEDNWLKLSQLSENLDSLSFDTIEKLITRLQTIEVLIENSPDVYRVWKHFKKLLDSFNSSNSTSTVPPDLKNAVEHIVARLEPINPELTNLSLFSHHDDEFYDESGSWEEKTERQHKKRRSAVEQICKHSGVSAIIEFADRIEEPVTLGETLGSMPEVDIEQLVLPALLDSKNAKKERFLHGYIRARLFHEGWTWLDNLNPQTWPEAKKLSLLLHLPFSDETWQRATKFLMNAEKKYWQRVTPNPYERSENIVTAVDALLSCGRPGAAITCFTKLAFEKTELPLEPCLRTLEALVSTKEHPNRIDYRGIKHVIRAVQLDNRVDRETKAQIEWQFLELIKSSSDILPTNLEQQLAADSKFFCQLVRLLYRGKDEPVIDEKDIDPKESAKATQAWSLLNGWQTPPGLKPDGAFSETDFESWLGAVRNECKKSGHTRSAELLCGLVLYYTPPDPDGLWLNKAVAKALNSKNAMNLRVGFIQKIQNSRGVHRVNPNGAPEFELSQAYRLKARSLETAGFPRLAADIMGVADSYEQEGKAIVQKYQNQA